MNTWTKLRTGSWGVRIPCTSKPSIGSSVTVTKRGGETKTVTISAVVYFGNGVALCSIGSSNTTTRKRAANYDRSCADCRRLGRMCKQCEFDEYDM